MMRVQIPAADPHDYPIVFGDAPPEELARELWPQVAKAKASRALVVTDDNVAPLYANAFCRTLPFDHALMVLPHGEDTKSFETVGQIVDRALQHRLTRQDLIIALGGGVIGDLAGFAASITLRGIDLVQVPTTLLAQVDSSVGGKTGVNHALGKNLIGAFWQPRAVIASQSVLKTLPKREIRCGLAEALKHGFISDPALLEISPQAAYRLEGPAIRALIEGSCRIKSSIVGEDPTERPGGGRRALLNFGHTFGHAYESLLGYGALSHGEAVALGMVWAARLSDRLLGGQHELETATRTALARFDLPYAIEDPSLPPLESLIEAAQADKKSEAGGIRFILLKTIGEAYSQVFDWPQIRQLLEPTP